MLANANEITYFLEVAATLNISRAAERLGITQPTLSLSMQRLEQSIGAALLIRGKTGVKLTKSGQRFYTHAKLLLDQWGKLRSETLREESEVQGRILIGCHPSVALYSVTGFLAQLMDQYPLLEIGFVHDLSRKVTEKVVSFEIDIGIVVNPISHPDLALLPLCRDEVAMWRGPEKYNQDILILDPDLLQTQAILSKLKKSEMTFKRTVHSSNLELIASLVGKGAGVGILPERVARRDANLGLKLLSQKGPTFQDIIYLIYRPDAQKGKAAKTVIEAIRRSFKE